jgi:hypothetical protein
MRFSCLCLTIILCVFSFNSFCQVNNDKDSITISNNNKVINIDSVPITKTKTSLHSPTKATLLSTFIPGAGQVYNRQAWKVPIIYVAAAAVTYFAVYNYNNKEKFKKEYYNRIDSTGTLLPDYVTYSNESIYNLYNAYKDNFQLSLIIGGVFYVANIVDAFVYGHLFSFDISDDISMNLHPLYVPSFNYSNNKNNSLLGFSLSLSF